jgi:HSP20 family protein
MFNPKKYHKMTLIKRNPNVPAFANFFDDFFAKDAFNWNDKNFADFGNTLPSVNVKEADQNFDIELAVPGMKKKISKLV